MKTLLCFCSLLTFGGLVHADESPIVYCTWNSDKTRTFDPAEWANDGTSTVIFRNIFDGNTSLSGSPKDLDLYGLVYEAAAGMSTWGTGGMFQEGGTYKLGAGGLTFKTRGALQVADRFGTCRMTLTANQTWMDERTSASDRSRVEIGYPYYYSASYAKMPIKASDGVTEWAIRGPLDVYFLANNNALADVSVTVSDGAKIGLIATYTHTSVRECDARLGARKLILKGDGERLIPQPSPNTGLPATAVTTYDAVHLACELELADGADLSLQNGLFAIGEISVTGTGTSEISGSFSNNLASTSVSLDETAELYLNAAISDGAAGASALTVTGSGLLRVNTDKYEATGTVTLSDDIRLQLEGSQTEKFLAQVSGKPTLIVSFGVNETNYMSNAALSNFSAVELLSGTLLVQSSRLPCTVTEKGGVLLDGTTVPWIVTDEVRTETELSLGAGEELKIYGSGLTDATAIHLTGGTLHFAGSATVSSPVDVSGAESWISADDGVTGSVAGAITANAILSLAGEGWKVLAGGATFTGNVIFRVAQGRARLLSGTYAFDKGSIIVGLRNTGDTDWGRELVVGNGATVTFAEYAGGSTTASISVHPRVDGANYLYESVLTVEDGGVIRVPGNRYVSLGNNQNVATLHMAGGLFEIANYSEIRFANGGYTTGKLIMDAGTLVLNRPFLMREATKTAQGYVIWNGGTIKLGKDWESGDSSLITTSLTGWTTLKVSVCIAGEDCVLDLTALPTKVTSVKNVSSAYESARNEWWGHGQLTVKGDKEFIMTAMPDGCRLRLEGDGTRVTFPADGRIYDYDVCAVNCVWRDPYRNAKYNVTNSWKSALGLAGLTWAGTNGVFTCNRDETPITVDCVTVAKTGVSDVVTGLPDGATFTDVTFETGATWVIGSARLDVPGDLLFGDMIRIAEETRPAYGPVLATAGESLTGNPTVEKAGSRKVMCVFDAVMKLVKQEFSGILMIVR